jgi:hypothetical protein
VAEEVDLMAAGNSDIHIRRPMQIKESADPE